MLKGYDLSNNNGMKNLASLDGDFYIFKATEGIDFIDCTLPSYAAQAMSLGKPFGVYHFMNGANTLSQAKFFLNYVKPYYGKCVLFLDYEADALKSKSEAEVLSFLEECERVTNTVPGVYMSNSVTHEKDWSKVAPLYPLWDASYGGGLPVPGHWSKVTIWQWDGTGIDKNYYYGTVKNWEDWSKLSRDKLNGMEDLPNQSENQPGGDVGMDGLGSWLEDGLRWYRVDGTYEFTGVQPIYSDPKCGNKVEESVPLTHMNFVAFTDWENERIVKVPSLKWGYVYVKVGQFVGGKLIAKYGNITVTGSIWDETQNKT